MALAKLTIPVPVNQAPAEMLPDSARCVPLRLSASSTSPIVVLHGGAGGGGRCIIAVVFPLTKVLSVSPRSSSRRPSCMRLSTNEIAAAVSWIATLRWPAPSHSAGNEASVSIERQRMSAQDSTKRLWTKHPTTGTARVVEARESRGACTGTRAGNQVSKPSIRMLTCSPVCGSPSDFAIIIAMPTNRCQG